MSANWMPQGLGATPKKTAALAILVAVLGVVAYNNFAGEDYPVASTAPRPAPANGTVTPATQMQQPAVRQTARAARPKGRGGNVDEFRPTVILAEDIDLTKIDPTLRTDLLARVRNAENAGGSRSLFEFYTPPPPPVKQPPPIIPKQAVAESKPADSKPPIPVKPPPTPIPLKYFGYQGVPQQGKMKALFIDPQGEIPYVVAVDDVIRNRFRVVRIGTTSAELEDTVEKNTQTLRIAERQDP